MGGGLRGPASGGYEIVLLLGGGTSGGSCGRLRDCNSLRRRKKITIQFLGFRWVRPVADTKVLLSLRQMLMNGALPGQSLRLRRLRHIELSHGRAMHRQGQNIPGNLLTVCRTRGPTARLQLGQLIDNRLHRIVESVERFLCLLGGLNALLAQRCERFLKRSDLRRRVSRSGDRRLLQKLLHHPFCSFFGEVGNILAVVFKGLEQLTDRQLDSGNRGQAFIGVGQPAVQPANLLLQGVESILQEVIGGRTGLGQQLFQVSNTLGNFADLRECSAANLNIRDAQGEIVEPLLHVANGQLGDAARELLDHRSQRLHVSFGGGFAFQIVDTAGEPSDISLHARDVRLRPGNIGTRLGRLLQARAGIGGQRLHMALKLLELGAHRRQRRALGLLDHGGGRFLQRGQMLGQPLDLRLQSRIALFAIVAAMGVKPRGKSGKEVLNLLKPCGTCIGDLALGTAQARNLLLHFPERVMGAPLGHFEMGNDVANGSFHGLVASSMLRLGGRCLRLLGDLRIDGLQALVDGAQRLGEITFVVFDTLKHRVEIDAARGSGATLEITPCRRSGAWHRHHRQFLGDGTEPVSRGRRRGLRSRGGARFRLLDDHAVEPFAESLPRLSRGILGSFPRLRFNSFDAPRDAGFHKMLSQICRAWRLTAHP